MAVYPETTFSKLSYNTLTFAGASLQSFINDYPPGCPPPLLMDVKCRLLDLGPDPVQFWRSKSAAAQGGCKIKKYMLAIPRVEVPAELQEAAAKQPEVQAALEAAASRHSLMAFQCCMRNVRQAQAIDPDRQEVLGLKMGWVGLLVQGRPGLFDLLYFPHEDMLCARDCNNDSVVFLLH